MIRQAEGIPRWFTWLVHQWRIHEPGGCRWTGHVGPAVRGGVCIRCGYEWTAEDVARREQEPPATRKAKPDVDS